ncbi:hypothetical protein I3843_01G147400 [Carya illinoinensis]|nr:hypothetical protein I3760_01G152000 [Carya illinoinensis]KAG7996212.1 hypothetical protein I3843_01G147400 [Carya illinoinensis]
MDMFNVGHVQAILESIPVAEISGTQSRETIIQSQESMQFGLDRSQSLTLSLMDHNHDNDMIILGMFFIILTFIWFLKNLGLLWLTCLFEMLCMRIEGLWIEIISDEVMHGRMSWLVIN